MKRMDINRLVFIGLLAILGVIMISEVAESCSCMPEHPQDTYCNSEYGKIVITFNLNYINYNL